MHCKAAGCWIIAVSPTACRQIIEVNLTSEDFKPIVPGAEIEFTYSVRWAPTATPFARRFERYLDYKFFGHQARARAHATLLRACAGLPLRCPGLDFPPHSLVQWGRSQTYGLCYRWRQFRHVISLPFQAECPAPHSENLPRACWCMCLAAFRWPAFAPDARVRGVQIHWFSIFNSSMILIFLTGLVAMILMRTLRADYARYTARDEDDLEVLPTDLPTPNGRSMLQCSKCMSEAVDCVAAGNAIAYACACLCDVHQEKTQARVVHRWISDVTEQ